MAKAEMEKRIVLILDEIETDYLIELLQPTHILSVDSSDDEKIKQEIFIALMDAVEGE